MKLNDLIIPVHEIEGLRKGLDVTGILTDIEYKYKSALLDLYSWRNGSATELDDNVPIFGFKFYSIEEGILIFNSPYMKDMKQFFPIGELGEALILLKMVENNPIYIYFSSEGDEYLYHESFDNLLNVSFQYWSTDGLHFDDIRKSCNKLAEL